MQKNQIMHVSNQSIKIKKVSYYICKNIEKYCVFDNICEFENVMIENFIIIILYF
jgi:hypothetical protein